MIFVHRNLIKLYVFYEIQVTLLFFELKNFNFILKKFKGELT